MSTAADPMTKDEHKPDEVPVGTESDGLSSSRRRRIMSELSPTSSSAQDYDEEEIHDEAASKKRIQEGKPLDSVAVIPSKAPLPIAAQRDFRGYILLVILVLLIIALALMIGIFNKVKGRTIIFAPTAERVGVVSASREPTGWEVQQQATYVMMQLENWSPASVQLVWEKMVPYLHSSLHEKMKRDYEALSKTAENLWSHRISLPLGVALTDSTAGTITAAVFYDSIEMTGRKDAERKLTAVSQKAVLIQFVYDTPTKDNPSGLLVMQYLPYDRERWIKQGYPDLWDAFRKLPSDAANKKKATKK